MSFVDLVNKVIRHNRDTIGDYGERLLLHIPVGIYMGLFPLSRGLRELFIAYEENEDVHTKDQAWKDYSGAMIGYIIGRALMWVVIIAIIVKVLT